MMINTETLRIELQRMMDLEGITPEEIHNMTEVHRATIYAILSGRGKKTQRAICRKIAEGMGWDFKITGDKIKYSKPEKKEQVQVLTEENAEFLRLWEGLSAPLKKQITELMRTMEESIDATHTPRGPRS